MNQSLYDKQGFVYVLQCPEFRHLLKIGATRVHPLRRAKELSRSSGSPTPFDIVYYRDFADCFQAETLIHRILAAERSNESREFFKISVEVAVKTVDRVAYDLGSEGVTGGLAKNAMPKVAREVLTPFAELFASFKDSDDPYLNTEECAQCRALENVQNST